MSAASVLSPATPTTRTSGPRAEAASFTPAAARAHTVHQGAQNHSTVFFPASSAPAKAMPSTVVARKASAAGTVAAGVAVADVVGDGEGPADPDVVGAGVLVEGPVVT